jgi:predicted phosphoadenosine phosphosulfate sulfurtransferase
MVAKRDVGINVLQAARLRIATVLREFERVYVSFSGGKDSSVLLHLTMEEAKRQGRRVGVLVVDLEAQYTLTIEHIRAMVEEYRDHIDPYWVCLPLNLRNAVSVFEPQWQCWDPDRRADWVREPPAEAITDPAVFPFFRRGMEFEEFVPAFGEWYAGGCLTACLVGIRTQESLNRWRTLTRAKARYGAYQWTTWINTSVYNAYPIYDWQTRDIWIYNGRFGASYNRLYDRMHQAGLSIHQQRICQPYGDDQRRGLWLYHLIEPKTWGRVVARVNGANAGALYARESGNITGVQKVTLPPGHTWQSFAHLLLDTLPEATAEHYRDKIAVFLQWYRVRGYPNGIPDEAGPKEEADKSVPSWRRVCKAILRNDYWCKGLSFSAPTVNTNYERYKKIMKKRRARWGLM